MKNTLKRIVPAPVWRAAGDGWDAVQRLKDIPGAYFHPWRRDSIRKLPVFHNRHKGERCFIMGNGPSLARTDISRLKNEFTIGMNRVYMAYPDWGFKNTYYASINDLVIEQCAEDILSLDLPKFIAWRSRRWLKPVDNLHFLYTSYTGPRFSRDITRRVWEGATVTFIAMQLAYYMGFQQVILIGVDHNFTTTGEPNKTIVSNGDDPNHFNPGYFGKGFRWQLPDLETSERGYCMAKDAYEADGREIIDATIDGKLRVFRRVDYDSLF